MEDRVYICIDLKSFYASVECIERKLDPMTTNLIVADESRTEKTIVLAVSPALKTFGIPGRPRLFEVIQKVENINKERMRKVPEHTLSGESYSLTEINNNPYLAVSYIVAPPRMAHYIQYSTKVYQVYLRFVAPEDIHVYSIDEVFIDITGYLHGGKTSHDFTMDILRAVIKETGITATAGIGTNLYLAKIAMDITAKKMPPDRDGVRIAELNQMSYREKLWDHRPLTDFWRVGPGYARKLEKNRMYTMGDIALCSVGKPNEIHNEELLYKLFGVNAELLIDHAWGWEPCTMQDIKAYKPESNSISSSQVLHQPYPYEKARLVVREMTELLTLDLVEKYLVTDRLVLTVGYDTVNLTDPEIYDNYKDNITTDRYGRRVPKHAVGTVNLPKPTSSSKAIVEAVMGLFDRITDHNLLIRRLSITSCRVINEHNLKSEPECEQLTFLEDYDKVEKKREEEESKLKRERKIQEAMLDIKNRYGKNAVLKGMNLEEGATARKRNSQIGGHKA